MCRPLCARRRACGAGQGAKLDALVLMGAKLDALALMGAQPRIHFNTSAKRCACGAVQRGRASAPGGEACSSTVHSDQSRV